MRNFLKVLEAIVLSCVIICQAAQQLPKVPASKTPEQKQRDLAAALRIMTRLKDTQHPEGLPTVLQEHIVSYLDGWEAFQTFGGKKKWPYSLISVLI